MRFILLFCFISVIFTINSGSILKDGTKEFYSLDGTDDDNAGEALYLTEHIEKGDIENAQRLALVSHREIPIESYAGYLTVNMFFWFSPAKVNSDDAPVILWLAGGPGSVAFALLGTGPYHIKSENIIPNEYAWRINHNILYIDNPVGTGYSFTDSDDGYSKNQEDVGQNLLIAFQQFFSMFPKLQKNDFFVSGHSYGGKYAPAIGYAIFQDNKHMAVDPNKSKINLKGLIIESGWTDPIHQINYADYFYQLGLIDSHGQELFREKQDKTVDCIKSGDLECAFNEFNQILNDVDLNSPSGEPSDNLFSNLTGLTHYHHILQTEYDGDPAIEAFLTKFETRHAIHTGNNTFHNLVKVLENLKLDFMDSVADWVSELLSHYPILFFHGQLDIICPYPLAQNYWKNLNFNGAEEYKTAKRYIWHVDNEVAGYVKQSENLTEILVRNAGHATNVDQTKWVFDILQRFTQQEPFN